MDKKEVRKTKNYTFSFFEPVEIYLDMLKSHEPMHTIVDVIVYNNNGNIVCSYRKEFDNEVNDGVIFNFINKFMCDDRYRKEYYIFGDDVDEVVTTESLTNKKCDGLIKKLNNCDENKLKFKDFAGLKTFGRDKVSSMKENQLVELLTSEIVEEIQSEKLSEDMYISALRWCVRGLNTKLSIRKVRVDEEVRKNCFRQ